MFLVLFVALVTALSASNKTAIDYYDSGDLKKAKSLFLATSNPDAMDHYYLGTILLREKNTNAAKENFEKGLQKDPANLYNSVGLAAIQMASDQKAADKALKAISGNKLYKKDAKMQTAIAEVYARANNPLFATYLAKAKKADKKSALPYILEGNLAMEQGKTNDAAVQFENARYFDPNSKVALVKLAQLYVNTRRQIAFEHLDKATSIDPNYEYGWITQANLRREVGFYPESIVAYEKYLSLVNPTPEDFQIYGQILYFAKKYDDAMNALNKAPLNTVTNRLKMYTMFDQDKFEEALPLAETLVTTSPKSELIYQDYAYIAEMYNKAKNYENAAKYFELAFESDTTRLGTLNKVAQAYDNAKNYPKAFEYYQKNIDMDPEHTQLDVFRLGQTYYFAGNDAATVTDEATRKAYLTKASEIFGQVAEAIPDNYLGLFWQARANSSMDPETTTGLGKPYYEKVLPLLLQTKDERKKEITEVYSYLAIYFLKKDDYKSAREYSVKVLEIDPENAIAKQIIQSIDSVRK